jgi:hypothetical protein
MSEVSPVQRSLFTSRLDKVYFTIHGVFLSLLLLMSFGFIPVLQWNNFGVRLVVATIFFSSFHTGLSWPGLLLLPEMRQWARAQWNSEGRFGKLRRWLFLSLLAFITYAVLEVYFLKSVSVEMERTLLLFLLIRRAVHNVGQTKGLTFMLTARNAKSQLSVKWERLIFKGFIFVMALGAIRFVSRSESQSVFWNSLLPARWELYCFVPGAILFGALMLVVYRQENTVRTKKFWFATTAIYYPLLLFSPAAFAFQRALHGIEYLFLAFRMSDRSKIKFTAVSWAVIAAPLLLILIALAELIRRVHPFFESVYISSFPFVTFTALWIEFTHYYLDSIMFRFQDPIVRETIGPLVADPS